MGSTVMAVALGGAIGSVARLLIGATVQQRAGTGFPLGTLLINVAGSFALGFFVRAALQTPAVTPTFRAFLTTGLCGGFTTFSTFSLDTAVLVEEGSYGRAALYVFASVVLAITGTFIGSAAARAAVGVVRGDL